MSHTIWSFLSRTSFSFFIPIAALAWTAACAEVAVPLGGELLAEPTALDFGSVAIGDGLTRELIVENAGDTEVTVELRVVEEAPAGYSVAPSSFALGPRQKSKVQVQFRPQLDVEYSGTIEVRRDGVATGRAVSLAGHGVSQGRCVEITPSVVDFGNVIVGGDANRELRVRNTCGSARTLRVELGTNVEACDASDPLASFCVSLPPSALGPDGSLALPDGGELLLEARFRPSVAETRELGSFTVAICESALCTFDVRLEGVGASSALRCDPSPLDFAAVDPGACLTRNVACENLLAHGVAVAGWRLVVGGGVPASPDFSVSPSRRIELDPEARVDVEVTYCPNEPGADAGVLRLELDPADPPLGDVDLPLVGRGRRRTVTIAPDGCLDFGLVSTIAPARRSVLLTNIGFAPVHITEVVADVAGTGTFTAPGASGAQLEPGASTSVVIEFQPTVTGAVESALLVRTSDPDTPELQVCLRGEGIELPPCSFEFTPTALDFGDVSPGRSYRRAVQIRNVGAAECLVTGVLLEPGTDPALSLPQPFGPSRRLPSGAALSVAVAYDPSNVGRHTGALQVSMSSPTSPFNRVAIEADAIGTNLLVVPSAVDFGTRAPLCTSHSERVSILNVGTTPMTVTSVAMEEGASFAITAAPSLPATVAPGGVLSFEVEQTQSTIATEVASAVRVDVMTQAGAVTQYVSLSATVRAEGVQEDLFEDVGTAPIDVLLVLDNTSSGASSFRLELAAFLEYAAANAVDYRVGTITTSIEGAPGQLLQTTLDAPFVSAASTPSPAEALSRNILLMGQGSGAPASESGLHASFVALTPPVISGINQGFIRSDARLSVVYLSDESDQSPNALSFYSAFLENVKRPGRRADFSAHAITGGPTGCQGPLNATPDHRYAELALRTGGTLESHCTTDWAANARNLGPAAFGFRRAFPLSAHPDPSTLEVRVDGVVVPGQSAAGAPNWTYDDATRQVLFAPTSPPSPGGTVAIRYAPECL